MDQEWRCISYSRGFPMPLLVYTWCKGSGCRKICHWDLKRNLNIHKGWYVLLIYLSTSVPSYSFCGYPFPISFATTKVLYQIPNLWCVLKNVGTFPAASSDLFGFPTVFLARSWWALRKILVWRHIWPWCVHLFAALAWYGLISVFNVQSKEGMDMGSSHHLEWLHT